LRAFVAIEVPSRDVIDRIVTFQKEIIREDASLKLVARENMHFTVKFLGDITDSQAAEASRRIAGLKLQRMDVTVAGVGAFPSASRPSVIWVGTHPADEPELGGLARSVIGALDGIGETDERPFKAHVTIARARNSSSGGKLASLLRDRASFEFGKVSLDSVKLKQSVLTPAGPVYSDLEVFPLA